MNKIIQSIHDLLIKNKKTISIAESCTGGIVSTLLTDIPGSSKYFIGSVICYSNKIKTDILKVNKKSLLKSGAVSFVVGRQLAENIRKLFKTDYSISITGIAGPSGGSALKPVGTVFICVSSKKKMICSKFNFKGSRREIRKKTAIQGLLLLKKAITL